MNFWFNVTRSVKDVRAISSALFYASHLTNLHNLNCVMNENVGNIFLFVYNLFFHVFNLADEYFIVTKTKQNDPLV